MIVYEIHKTYDNGIEEWCKTVDRFLSEDKAYSVCEALNEANRRSYISYDVYDYEINEETL